jgi:GNAT superfamily N-acetyltransferase
MRIQEMSLSGSGDLADLYNKIVDAVPHCFPVSPDEFAIAQPPGSHGPDDPDLTGLHGERLLVGISEGTPVAFAHMACGTILHQGKSIPGGFLHFIGYLPGQRQIAQTLLDECESYLRSAGEARIYAFHGYLNEKNYKFYHFGFPCLSDRLLHVHGLLCHNGFTPKTPEVFLQQEIPKIGRLTPPEGDVGIDIRELPGGQRPGLEVRAIRGGNEIASCYAESGGAFCQHASAQEVLFVDGMSVTEDATGKGLGRYLMLRMFQESRALGYLKAVTATELANTRALLFYTNLGYKTTDMVYALTKNLR